MRHSSSICKRKKHERSFKQRHQRGRKGRRSEARLQMEDATAVADSFASGRDSLAGRREMWPFSRSGDAPYRGQKPRGQGRSQFAAGFPYEGIQGARVDQIRRQVGIIGPSDDLDPDKDIALIVKDLGEQAIRDMGLNPKDYVFVVTDSDEINAAIYASSGENVVEFTWGLLQFLKKNDKKHRIFNKDTLKFILGHEGGHSFNAREANEGKYRHSRLTDEYEADRHGTFSTDQGDGVRAYTPLAGLRLIQALREAQKTMTITWTHPQTHRREIKMYNDIRDSYWENLDGDPENIPEAALAIPRSGRFAFDEQLYNTLTFQNLRRTIANASSYHDILKATHLFNTLFEIHSVLSEFEEPTGSGLQVEFNITEKAMRSIIRWSGKDHIERFLRDSAMNPNQYLKLSSQQMIAGRSFDQDVGSAN